MKPLELELYEIFWQNVQNGWKLGGERWASVHRYARCDLYLCATCLQCGGVWLRDAGAGLSHDVGRPRGGVTWRKPAEADRPRRQHLLTQAPGEGSHPARSVEDLCTSPGAHRTAEPHLAQTRPPFIVITVICKVNIYISLRRLKAAVPTAVCFLLWIIDALHKMDFYNIVFQCSS